MKELISVIIPVYNAEQYLDRCLKSVIDNTYKNLEVILVDDGSIDNSPSICDKYAKEDSRFVVMHKENGGTAQARNDALEIAKGDYIAFLDNDDYISPHYYEYMLKAIKDTDSDIVVSEMTRKDEYDFLKNQEMATAILVDKHDFILGTYTGDWTRNTAPWNKLYKKELFNNIKFPLGKGYEDAYTTYRLLYEAKKISYLNNVLYCWYENNESYSSKKDKPEKLFFREEALRLQSQYYSDIDYNDVKIAAIRLYFDQMLLMYWQLTHDYKNSTNLKNTIKKFRKTIKKQFLINLFYLEEKQRNTFLENFYPKLYYLIKKVKK